MTPFLKRSTFATLAAGFVCSTWAQGSTAAREGTPIVVEFTATVKTAGRFADGNNATTSSAVSHVLKGRCRLEAGAVGAYGLEGPTREQEKALSRVDPGMAALEKEHAKCRGNQACQMALAQKMTQQDFKPAAPQVEGAVQVWMPQACSGSFTADDRFAGDIKDGPGLSYAYKSTVTGTAAIPDRGPNGWLGLYIETDLERNETRYRFNQPDAAQLDKKTVRTGYQAGTTVAKVAVGLLPGAEAGPTGPLNYLHKGPLQSGTVTRKIGGGTLTLEWQVKR